MSTRRHKYLSNLQFAQFPDTSKFEFNKYLFISTIIPLSAAVILTIMNQDVIFDKKHARWKTKYF